jgi:hypothetical protein
VSKGDTGSPTMIETKYKVIFAAFALLAVEESLPTAITYMFPLKKAAVLQYIADLPKPYYPKRIGSTLNDCEYVPGFFTYGYELCVGRGYSYDTECGGWPYIVRARSPSPYLGSWKKGDEDRMIVGGRFVAVFVSSGEICSFRIGE